MVMQFERRYSRSDYDKYHRCPGWSGGGWTLAKEGKCPGGYITFGLTYEDLADKGHADREFWSSYPSRWAWGQCSVCQVRVLPLWTRWLDPTWLWWKYRKRHLLDQMTRGDKVSFWANEAVLVVAIWMLIQSVYAVLANNEDKVCQVLLWVMILGMNRVTQKVQLLRLGNWR